MSKNSAGRSAAGKGRRASSPAARAESKAAGRSAATAANRNTPDRLARSATLRIDRAMARSKGNDVNFVTLDALRTRLGGSRESQDALIRRARIAGTHTLNSFEGLHGRLTPAEKAASIVERSGTYVYVSRSGDASLVPSRGTGRGRRR